MKILYSPSCKVSSMFQYISRLVSSPVNSNSLFIE